VETREVLRVFFCIPVRAGAVAAPVVSRLFRLCRGPCAPLASFSPPRCSVLGPLLRHDVDLARRERLSLAPLGCARTGIARKRLLRGTRARARVLLGLQARLVARGCRTLRTAAR
jgi:hypothetical protein